MTAGTRTPTVLLLSHGFQLAYERGFSNGLAHLGVRVELVSSDRTDSARIDGRVRLLNLRGSQDEQRSVLQKALNLARYHGRLLLLALNRRGAIFHVIGMLQYPVITGILEGLLFRAVSRRYVLTVHDLLPHGHHDFWNQRLFSWIYRIPQVLVVHTETMKEDLVKRFGVPSMKVLVMEHGCEMEISGMSTAIGIPTRGCDNKTFSLLFFGMVTPYKGLDLLLKAFDELGHDFELNIVGKCVDPGYCDTIQEAISRSPAHDRIAWRNEYVSEEEVAHAFSIADALVLPYRHIDQSGVLFQAFRFGVPIVASRVGEFGRYVGRDYGEVFAPGDIGDLRSALRRLYRRRHEFSRDRIVARGFQLDWRNTVTALKPIYSGAPTARADR